MGGVKIAMNKFISILISAALILGLTACTSDSSGDELKIVTTMFPQYDFSKQITNDNANITLLLTPGSESHSYEPTAKDIAMIQQADLFIYNGGVSEVWVDKVMESFGSNSPETLRLMDYVEPLKSEHEHSDEESHEHEDEEYDEHIFTSLKNSEILLDVINDKICEIDTDNSEIYIQNTNEYKSQISALDEKFESLTENSKRNTVVFGDRFPFRYFAEDYSLDCHAAFSGCSSETDASPATISELINIVNSENIPVVFYLEFSNKSIAEKISSATGAKTLLLHSCHNISKDDINSGITYVDLMTQNYENLSEALN